MALKLSFQLLFLLILAAGAAVAATEDDQMIAESKQCVQEMQKNPLTICRLFLKYGGDSAAGRPFLRYESGNAENLIKCCEQLHQVSDTCRCELLNKMTGEIMKKDMKGDQYQGQLEEMRMRGVFLPLMCNIGPPCRLSYGGGDAAVVKY
ncbi:hypothetical protein KFK09_002225 [Dendrobium nobile]|uniref:Bifunctional inhibitor/plant lipid transfer protein/seed storage helical domain-containing protein n=1 Tax=Dendrobium nobile TaxID=94219 RepID=A0A8T3CCD4_DENNO|nr:hypothetical protein KFK09_002225 [Dendrobium nobile]